MIYVNLIQKSDKWMIRWGWEIFEGPNVTKIRSSDEALMQAQWKVRKRELNEHLKRQLHNNATVNFD